MKGENLKKSKIPEWRWLLKYNGWQETQISLDDWYGRILNFISS